MHPEVSRRTSEALSSISNGIQERSNSSLALCYYLAKLGNGGAGVNRMLVGKGIVSEAKACGKAAGYADGDTAIWKVEEPVGVNTL